MMNRRRVVIDLLLAVLVVSTVILCVNLVDRPSVVDPHESFHLEYASGDLRSGFFVIKVHDREVSCYRTVIIDYVFRTQTIAFSISDEERRAIIRIVNEVKILLIDDRYNDYGVFDKGDKIIWIQTDSIDRIIRCVNTYPIRIYQLYNNICDVLGNRLESGEWVTMPRGHKIDVLGSLYDRLEQSGRAK